MDEDGIKIDSKPVQIRVSYGFGGLGDGMKGFWRLLLPLRKLCWPPAASRGPKNRSAAQPEGCQMRPEAIKKS